MSSPKSDEIIRKEAITMEKVIYLKGYAEKEGFTESLAFRSVARAIYDSVTNDINVAQGDIINCKFNDIDMCDVSFADEFIINFQKMLLEVENTLLRLMNVNEHVRENIEGALMLRNKKDHSKICLLTYEDGAYSIIGDIEKNLNETFSLIVFKPQITARDVAQRFNIEINSASNRLKKLYNLRLLQRQESIDESGRQHIYYLPK